MFLATRHVLFRGESRHFRATKPEYTGGENSSQHPGRFAIEDRDIFNSFATHAWDHYNQRSAFSRPMIGPSGR